MTLQAHRQIEVIIGVAGVGSHGLAKERASVVPLPAHRNSLIINHFCQRKDARHAGKGSFSFIVVAGKDQRQPAVKARFQCVRIAAVPLWQMPPRPRSYFWPL